MSGTGFFVFLAAIAIGGAVCFLVATLIVDGLRRINPVWVDVPPPPLPPVPRKKTKLIPRREAVALMSASVFQAKSIVLGDWKSQFIEPRTQSHGRKA